jgi:hypothetical protein
MLLPLVLIGCVNDYGLAAPEAVDITIETPTYGMFTGSTAPIEVRGSVVPHNAVVKVDGQRVPVDAEGRFTAAVPFTDRYHVVDVQAAAGPAFQRVRIPVFDQHDPRDAWPDGVTLRVTGEGLDHIGAGLGAYIDATGWDTQLAAALPTVDTGSLDLVPTGVTHDPTQVVLDPQLGGIDTGIQLRKVAINYDMTANLFGSTYTDVVIVSFETVQISTVATPKLDAAGLLSLELSDATIDLGPADFKFGVLEGWVTEWLVDMLADVLLEPIAEILLDSVMSLVGDIPLGGPYEYAADLVGMPVEIALSDVYADPNGLGAGLGVGLGEPAPAGPLAIPAPRSPWTATPVHAALGLHEAVVQMALDNFDIGTMLKQDIQLSGPMSELLGNAITNLPGGSKVPSHDGWCISLDPQPNPDQPPAQVVRMQEGVDPLATLYLPDLNVTIGYANAGTCSDWLEASLATEIGIKVKDGTKISVDIGFEDGAVLAYGAPTELWTEEGVITGLASFVGGFASLLGGQLSFDLADLTGMGTTPTDPTADPTGLGALLGDVKPRIVGSTQMNSDDGQPIEGLFNVQLQLWD